MRSILIGTALCAFLFAVHTGAAKADKQSDTAIKRGEYLVRLGGCGDCHTPGHFLGKPDQTKHLSGSDVGFQTPEGTFVGPNLTSDKETGLGNWTRADIVKALQTGVRPDGRILSGTMPWRTFANITKSDANAIAAYLMSLKPVSHQVPSPLAAGGKPAFPVLTLVFPEKTAP